MSDTKTHISFLENEAIIQAIRLVGDLADQNNIEWALAGGLAVILYGSTRKIDEIDIIAARTLPIYSHGLLKQGGARYEVQTVREIVQVDWIVRKDEAMKFYQAALRDSVMVEGITVITPEWLVILKYIAGRAVDREDSVFLLSYSNTVNRQKINRLVLETGGNETWAVMKYGLQRWFNAADGKTESCKTGYVDS